MAIALGAVLIAVAARSIAAQTVGPTGPTDPASPSTWPITRLVRWSATDATYALRWHPNGTHLLAGDSGGVASVFTAGANSPYPPFWPIAALRTFTAGAGTPLYGVAWWPTPALAPAFAMTASGDTNVRLYGGSADISTWSGTPVRTFTGHAGAATSIAIHPTGGYALTCDIAGFCRLWGDGTTTPTAWSTSASRVFVGPDLVPSGGGVWSVDWHPSGSYFAAGACALNAIWVWGNNTVSDPRAWNATSQARLVGHSNCIDSLAFSPNGNWLFSAGDDRSVRVWGAAGNSDMLSWPTVEVRGFAGPTNAIYAIRLHPTGNWLIVTDADGGVRMWGAANVSDPLLWPVSALSSVATGGGEIDSADWHPSGWWYATGHLTPSFGVQLRGITCPSGMGPTGRTGLGTGTCLDCGYGAFAPNASSQCLQCPGYAITTSTRATSCVTCSAGAISNVARTTCIPCPAGTAAATAATICSVCPAATISTSPGATSCTACPAGSDAVANRTLCTACGVGQFAPNPGTVCRACPVNTVSESPGAAACTGCPPGTQASARGDRCEPCNTGSYNPSANGTCAVCPWGTYADAVGSAACAECPQSTWQGLAAPRNRRACRPATVDFIVGLLALVSFAAFLVALWWTLEELVEVTCPRGKTPKWHGMNNLRRLFLLTTMLVRAARLTHRSRHSDVEVHARVCHPPPLPRRLAPPSRCQTLSGSC